jgi:hypothetical protein
MWRKMAGEIDDSARPVGIKLTRPLLGVREEQLLAVQQFKFE